MKLIFTAKEVKAIDQSSMAFNTLIAVVFPALKNLKGFEAVTITQMVEAAKAEENPWPFATMNLTEAGDYVIEIDEDFIADCYLLSGRNAPVLVSIAEKLWGVRSVFVALVKPIMPPIKALLKELFRKEDFEGLKADVDELGEKYGLEKAMFKK